MFEKVSPMHVDKIADRISGAIVDMAYKLEENPKVAVEVMVGHGVCHIIVESSKKIDSVEICKAVARISQELLMVDYKWYPQDVHLARNQKEKIRCGDNGIFRGVPLTEEQKTLSKIAREMYEKYPFDGKFVLDGKKLIICQSNAKSEDIRNYLIEKGYGNYDITINPLGEWHGGTQTDSGCCLNENTLIYTSKGLKKIKDLKISDIVHTENGQANIVDFIDNGIKSTKVIRDEYNHKIEATYNHPFRVFDGNDIVWKQCDKLKKGDILLKKKISHIVNSNESSQSKKIKKIKYPIFSDSGIHEKIAEKTIRIDADFAYLIGWLIGDGNNTAKDRLIFYFGNEEEKCHLKVLLNKVFGKDMIKYYECQPDRFSVLSQGLVKSLGENGLSQSLSHEKSVPEFILQGNDKIKAAFLSGLFDADGSVQCRISEGRTEEAIRISLVTVSETLAQQVGIILHSIGIESTIVKRKHNENSNEIKGKKIKTVHVAYSVIIRGVKSSKLFLQKCGFRLKCKQKRYENHKFKKLLFDDDTYYLFDVVSELLDYNKTKKNKYFPRFKQYNREGFKSSSIDYILDMYAEFNETEIYQKIKYIYDNYEMVKIKDISDGMSQTYDITLDDDTHSFIANGFVVHNTNRKLGSDMADGVTGGGLHGKDISKADVSVNIYTFLKAQETGKVVELSCAIGDEKIDGKPYEEIVKIAKDFIDEKGGFEKFSEWGLF